MIIKTNENSSIELVVENETAICKCNNCGFTKNVDLQQKAVDVLLIVALIAQNHENCKVEGEPKREKITLKKDLTRPEISKKEIADLYGNKKPEGRFSIAALKKYAVEKVKKENGFSGVIEVDDNFIKSLFNKYVEQFS